MTIWIGYNSGGNKYVYYQKWYKSHFFRSSFSIEIYTLKGALDRAKRLSTIMDRGLSVKYKVDKLQESYRSKKREKLFREAVLHLRKLQ